MKINYTTVITKEDLELLNEKEYEEIRLICEAKVKRTQDKAYKVVSVSDNMQTKAYDFAFRDEKFTNMPYFKKILIATNVVYFNNETFINILLSKNITYKILFKTVSKIKLIKELALMKDEYELDESTTISNKNLNAICSLIRKFYSYDDPNLIVAKLVEIVVFQKELYLTLEGGKQKKHTN